jgi:hypothetical protein
MERLASGVSRRSCATSAWAARRPLRSPARSRGRRSAPSRRATSSSRGSPGDDGSGEPEPARRRNAWHVASIEQERAGERLAAFGRLPEAEQVLFFKSIARLTELQQRAARAEVVAP